MKKEVIILGGLLFMMLFLINGILGGFNNLESLNKDGKDNEINDYVSGELIIRYKDNIIIEDKEVIKELAVVNNVEKPSDVEKIVSGIELYNLKFDSMEDVEIEGIVEKYENMEDVEYAELNYIMKTFDSFDYDDLDYDLDFEIFNEPDDDYYSLQWGLKNINANLAWNLTTGNSSVVIAIIDTGVDWDHPDLAGDIWNNSDEDCFGGIDDDGNGYIDDCRGYDFVNVSFGCSDNDCDNEDNNPMDFQGHGTHCSGIAGGVSNNNLGITGVCWNCSIMPIRAGYKDTNGNGALAIDDIAQALYYASDNNAVIISMSFGGSDYATIQQAIDYAYANGSILVAAAGNNGDDTKVYPCGYDNVICVSGINSDNSSASSSNYGDWVNLSAPGTGIWSTYYDDVYSNQSGTSMATPFVAGGIGLIKSLFWNKNQTEIVRVLSDTGILVDFNGIGIPRINIYSAILSLDNLKPNVSLISPLNNQINVSQNQTFSCNTSDWQLENISLQVWNSSNDLYYSETKNISGIFNETSFDVELDYETYHWNCLVYDAEDNYAYANSNFTLYIGNLSIDLISPVNDSYRNLDYIYFNCSAQTESGKTLTNVTFYLWNSSDLVYDLTVNLSGIFNSFIFNYSFSVQDEYEWNCRAYNNISESAIGVSNFSLIYDNENPNVSLISPADSLSYTSNSQTIVFGFNVSDNNEIANCSLIVNGIVNLTNNSVDKNIIQNFSQSFSPGTYNWNVNCSDDAGNIGNSSVRSFGVSAPVVDTSGGSGGGGGGGGSSSSSTSSALASKTYVISNEQISKGYSQKLKTKDKIKFIFFNEKAEEHVLSVNEIKENFVNITIKSNVINLILGIGQSAKLNLTSSDYYDLYVKLNSIKNNKAELTIQTIHEEIPKVPVTGKVVEEKQEPLIKEENEDVEKELKKLKTIIYILVVVVILVIIYLLFREKKYIKIELEKIGGKKKRK